mmetsp:Transcript_32893/g.104122  ORF Transcript_32893/g.104122 Transcript_32893/m.104122 type:complete len:208 (+) Transcript_32893:2334-2957(+)
MISWSLAWSSSDRIVLCVRAVRTASLLKSTSNDASLSSVTRRDLSDGQFALSWQSSMAAATLRWMPRPSSSSCATTGRKGPSTTGSSTDPWKEVATSAIASWNSLGNWVRSALRSFALSPLESRAAGSLTSDPSKRAAHRTKRKAKISTSRTPVPFAQLTTIMIWASSVPSSRLRSSSMYRSSSASSKASRWPSSLPSKRRKRSARV